METYGSPDELERTVEQGLESFPVFVKPKTGSGSVGAERMDNMEQLKGVFADGQDLIIQKFMQGTDIDADVYVDTISHMAVSAFLKKKLETKIGGASKAVSFCDDALFQMICEIVSEFQFCGPIDMDFFFEDGRYYLSEINPRFGGAYLHAYGSGVDFARLIENNVKGLENKARFGDYKEGIVMMMYDSVVIQSEDNMDIHKGGKLVGRGINKLRFLHRTSNNSDRCAA